MGEFDIIRVEKPKAQTEPPNILANEGGLSKAPSESVVFTAQKESPQPEVDFTSQSNGVEWKEGVVFTSTPKYVTSKPQIFSSSTRAAGESHIQEKMVEFGKSMFKGSGLASNKETERHLVESGMYCIWGEGW